MVDTKPGSEAAAPRRSPAPARLAGILLGSLLTLGALAWAGDLFRAVGIQIMSQQFVAGMLALSLALAFLHFPVRKAGPSGCPSWYDWLAAGTGLAAGLYLTVRLPNLVDIILMRPLDGVIAGLTVILLMLEALRRTTGWALTSIVFLFLLYGLFGDLLPMQMAARGTDWERLTAYLAIDYNGILGLPIIVACTVIITFVLFGNLLLTTGGASFLSDLSLALMGRYRGGPAKIAVLGSALFGTVSGSAVANVAATGVITIPWMKAAGYPPHRAAAIEAVASTGGQIMPPMMGASAFLIAEFLQIPFAEVLLAALVPALLYYFSIFIQVDLEAGRLGISRLPEDQIPNLWKVLFAGWHYLLPFVALIVALFSYNLKPELAVLLAIGVLLLCSLLFGYKGHRPSFVALVKNIYQTGVNSLDIILITAGAGAVIGVLALSGLGFNMTLALVSFGADSLFLMLLLTAVICIILGMGLPTVGVYVLLAALVAPALVEMDVLPLSAHLFVMYFGLLSFVTPPIAVAAFAAASIAKADPIHTGFEAMRFGWTAYIIPLLFVASPALLMIGEPLEIIGAVTTAAMGVWLGSIGMVGYFVRRVPYPMRVLFIAAGVLALIPSGAFPLAIYTDFLGVIGGALLVGWELWASRPRALASSEVL